MEESVVKRNNSTKFEIYRETKGVRELIKIIFSKKALVAIASNAITVLLMIFAQVTRNISEPRRLLWHLDICDNKPSPGYESCTERFPEVNPDSER